jgi:hypothetical protein
MNFSEQFVKISTGSTCRGSLRLLNKIMIERKNERLNGGKEERMPERELKYT